MKVPCKQCGTLIMPSTFETNAGLCMLCKVGFFICEDCGKRVLKANWNRQDTRCLTCLEKVNQDIVRKAMAAGEYQTVVYSHCNKGVIISTVERRLENIHKRMPGIKLLTFDDHSITLAAFNLVLLDTFERELADLEPMLGLRRRDSSSPATAARSRRRILVVGALAAAFLLIVIVAAILWSSNH